MSRNNDADAVVLVLVGVTVFFLAIMGWLMTTFDVEWKTALQTARGMEPVGECL